VRRTFGAARRKRLLANIPGIEKGFLPVLIPGERRLKSIESLTVWQMASGRPNLDNTLAGNPSALLRSIHYAPKCSILLCYKISSSRGSTFFFRKSTALPGQQADLKGVVIEIAWHRLRSYLNCQRGNAYANRKNHH